MCLYIETNHYINMLNWSNQCVTISSYPNLHGQNNSPCVVHMGDLLPEWNIVCVHFPCFPCKNTSILKYKQLIVWCWQIHIKSETNSLETSNNSFYFSFSLHSIACFPYFVFDCWEHNSFCCKLRNWESSFVVSS